MDEIKKSPEGEEEVRRKRQKQFNNIFFAIFFLAISFFLWTGFELAEPNRLRDEARRSVAEKKQSPEYSYSDTSTYTDDSIKPNPNEWKPGINVVATPVQLGDDLIIRTRVSNKTGGHIDETIKIFVTDATGTEYFVDAIFAKLSIAEVGNITSSIKVSELGPSPYRVLIK